MNDFITIDTSNPTAVGIKDIYEPYKLVSEDDPILKQVMPEFDFNSDVDPKELANRLQETAKRHRAFGVAAPQCGLPYRVLSMGAEDEYMTLFNPEIVNSSQETSHLDEGCLSFPFLILGISRSKTVTVKFQTETGENKIFTLDGMSARIVQHEIDHLNGITFESVAKPLALKMGLKKKEKRMKQWAKTVLSQRMNQQ